jgi:hypothetical protein
MNDYVSFIEIFTSAGNHTFPKDEDRTWQQTFDRTVTKNIERNWLLIKI